MDSNCDHIKASISIFTGSIMLMSAPDIFLSGDMFSFLLVFAISSIFLAAGVVLFRSFIDSENRSFKNYRNDEG